MAQRQYFFSFAAEKTGGLLSLMSCALGRGAKFAGSPHGDDPPKKYLVDIAGALVTYFSTTKNYNNKIKKRKKEKERK